MQKIIECIKSFISILLITAFCCSCVNNSAPINRISNIQNNSSQTAIRDWKLSGPFLDAATYTWHQLKDGTNELKYESLTRPENSFVYHQTHDFINLNKTLKTNKQDTYSKAAAYATCIIKSEVEQDVAFLIGMHDAADVWLNSKLILSAMDHGSISKNQYAIKVHLKKGDNNISVKIYNTANGTWGFNFDVSAVNYVRKYAFGGSYFSISEHYLVKKNDSLSLRIKYPSFVPCFHAAQLLIINSGLDTVVNRRIASGQQWKIPLIGLKEGVYQCRLTTDADTFKQAFVYGNYQNIFNAYKKRLAHCHLNDRALINTETLFHRFTYLDDFGKKNQYGEWLDRKISANLFDIASIQNKLSQSKEAFSGLTGLHLRGFRSLIDHSPDNYMIYIPENYTEKHKLPLVVMMPYVTKQAPFVESWHLADITRIEFIEKLANSYGFAILWPSSRIYKNYNLNPIVSAATFEAIAAVKKDYEIDGSRVYLYGDCSGGLQALLIADRFPSLFAAIGVEGPELSYSADENRVGQHPNTWIKNNNLLHSAQNFRNIPTYILHTPSDEKAQFEISRQLKDSIRHYNGYVKFDNMNDVTKTAEIKMISENIIIADIMNFFKSKVNRVPDTVTYATYQLKYNKAYWLTLEDIEYPKKAIVKAIYKGNNSFEVSSSNVNAYDIDVGQIKTIDQHQPIKVVNNHTVYTLYAKNGKIKIVLKLTRSNGSIKNKETEGPVNDLFSKSFIVVRGTLGAPQDHHMITSATDTFAKNWKMNYFANCKIKNDNQISKADIKDNNLILIGSDRSNSIIKKICNLIPLTVKKDYVEISNKKTIGKNLSYMVICPNPLNPTKYILIVGSNTLGQPSWDKIKDLPLKGWYDYEVWDSFREQAFGYFDNSPLQTLHKQRCFANR